MLRLADMARGASSHELVVTTRYHVPRHVHLPVEFHSSGEIELYEFVDIQIQCYVFLRLIGKLRKREGDDSYTFVPATDEYDYAVPEITAEDLSKRQGPARVFPDGHTLTQFVAGRRVESIFSEDRVDCIRCLQWPSQSAEWLTRVRRYNRSDTATIQRVVGCGCDVVFTVQRRYKHDEWFKRRMHRISFLRAETFC